MLVLLFLLLVVSLNQSLIYWISLVIFTLFIIIFTGGIKNLVLFFFVQEISVITFFYFIVFNISSACLPLMMKMATPPLHFWALSLFYIFNSKTYILFLSLMKIVPVILLYFLCSSSLIPILFLGTTILFFNLFEEIEGILLMSSGNMTRMFPSFQTILPFFGFSNLKKLI